MTTVAPTTIRRLVRMTFRENALEEFLELFHRSKNQIRSRPGCLHLELWQDAGAPHICTTYSIWESQDYLDEYRRSELFGQIWPATKTLFAEAPVAFSVHQAVVVE